MLLYNGSSTVLVRNTDWFVLVLPVHYQPCSPIFLVLDLGWLPYLPESTFSCLCSEENNGAYFNEILHVQNLACALSIVNNNYAIRHMECAGMFNWTSYCENHMTLVSGLGTILAEKKYGWVVNKPFFVELLWISNTVFSNWSLFQTAFGNIVSMW